MSPLENAIQEQLGLANKGYSVEQIQCAALQIIADRMKQFCDQMDTLLEYADHGTN